MNDLIRFLHFPSLTSAAKAGLLALMLMSLGFNPACAGQTFIREAKLTGFNSSTNDFFGNAVAISGDTAVVGAYQDRIGGNALQGSAYVFVRSNADWLLQQQLVVSNGVAGQRFGSSVTIEGDTLAVGAWGDGSYGAVYLYTRTGTNWSLQQKLAPTNTTSVGDFGWSVSLSGDTLLIGAPDASSGGSAYVYTRSNNAWTPQAFLGAPVPVLNNKFGYSVSLSTNTALVGCYQDTVSGRAAQGSAYVFTRTGTNWSFQAQLVAPDGLANDWFGFNVTLAGDTAICGEHRDTVNAKTQCGSASVFVRNGTTWSFTQKLVAPDSSANDNFGRSLAVSGDILFVGALLDDVLPLSGTGIDQGSAYVFTRSNGVWELTQKLIAFDRANSDAFSSALAVDGLSAIIGAHLDDFGTAANQGSVHTYRAVPDNFTWYEQKITALDSFSGDHLGHKVAISGNTAVVGASDELDSDSDSSRGQAYIFVRNATHWSLQQILLPPVFVAGENFGRSVAISGDTVIIGAPGSQEGLDDGAAYIFVRNGTNWSFQQKLISPDTVFPLYFGLSVGIHGDTCVVSPVGRDAGDAVVFVRNGSIWSLQGTLTASGTEYRVTPGSVAIERDTIILGVFLNAAYVFTRTGTTWSQQQKLVASDSGSGFDTFGLRVALSGETAFVSWAGKSVGGANRWNVGMVYVFSRSGTSWTEHQMLTASDGDLDDFFGYSVSLSDDLAVIGTSQSDSKPGAAYVFKRSGTNWIEQHKLTPSDGAPGDKFGYSVGIEGLSIVVGAPFADLATGTNQGAVYFYGTEPFGVVPPGPTPIVLRQPMRLGSGAFQFTFTNTPGQIFTALASTNVTLPANNWTVLGAPTEIAPGQFQFTDSQATNGSFRFYRVRFP